jgi:hypothetical protein
MPANQLGGCLAKLIPAARTGCFYPALLILLWLHAPERMGLLLKRQAGGLSATELE